MEKKAAGLLEKGEAYLIEETTLDLSVESFVGLVKSGLKGAIFSEESKDDLIKKYPALKNIAGETRFYQITDEEVENAISPIPLSDLDAAISSIGREGDYAILIEFTQICKEYKRNAQALETYLEFFKDYADSGNCILIASVNPKAPGETLSSLRDSLKPFPIEVKELPKPPEIKEAPKVEVAEEVKPSEIKVSVLSADISALIKKIKALDFVLKPIRDGLEEYLKSLNEKLEKGEPLTEEELFFINELRGTAKHEGILSKAPQIKKAIESTLKVIPKLELDKTTKDAYLLRLNNSRPPFGLLQQLLRLGAVEVELGVVAIPEGIRFRYLRKIGEEVENIRAEAIEKDAALKEQRRIEASRRKEAEKQRLSQQKAWEGVHKKTISLGKKIEGLYINVAERQELLKLVYDFYIRFAGKQSFNLFSVTLAEIERRILELEAMANRYKQLLEGLATTNKQFQTNHARMEAAKDRGDKVRYKDYKKKFKGSGKIKKAYERAVEATGRNIVAMIKNLKLYLQSLFSS